MTTTYSVNVHLPSWLADPRPSDPMAIFDNAPDEPVADLGRFIEVEFDYPLDPPLRRTIAVDGNTVADFVTAIAKAYETIYAEEAADGRHGIWGHGMGDMFLEGFHRRDDGAWGLYVGS